MKKGCRLKYLVFLIGIITFWIIGFEVKADEPLVIVIDPGHGGENLGGQYEEYTEKEINPIVARAMK